MLGRSCGYHVRPSASTHATTHAHAHPQPRPLSLCVHARANENHTRSHSACTCESEDSRKDVWPLGGCRQGGAWESTRGVVAGGRAYGCGCPTGRPSATTSSRHATVPPMPPSAQPAPLRGGGGGERHGAQEVELEAAVETEEAEGSVAGEEAERRRR